MVADVKFGPFEVLSRNVINLKMAGTENAKCIAIAVHGGAWAVPDHLVEQTTASITKALQAGYSLLAYGTSAMEAVETAINILEDDPLFDAGTGSMLNAKGEVEMDALIMDGATLRSGSVMGIDNVIHPISVARKVLETTPHAILAGEGAKHFAASCGVETINPSRLITEAARDEWKSKSCFEDSLKDAFENSKSNSHDTVGCIALDSAGNIVAGTSTGGITMKMEGRVGDSPVIGCGAFADNELGACSTTGHGESILRVMLAHRAVAALEHKTPQEAAIQAISYMKDRVNGFGGLIVLNPKGETAVAYSTKRMVWGLAKGTAGEYEPSAFKTGCDCSGSSPGGIRFDGIST